MCAAGKIGRPRRRLVAPLTTPQPVLDAPPRLVNRAHEMAQALSGTWYRGTGVVNFADYTGILKGFHVGRPTNSTIPEKPAFVGDDSYTRETCERLPRTGVNGLPPLVRPHRHVQVRPHHHMQPPRASTPMGGWGVFHPCFHTFAARHGLQQMKHNCQI